MERREARAGDRAREWEPERGERVGKEGGWAGWGIGEVGPGGGKGEGTV